MSHFSWRNIKNVQALMRHTYRLISFSWHWINANSNSVNMLFQCQFFDMSINHYIYKIRQNCFIESNKQCRQHIFWNGSFYSNVNIWSPIIITLDARTEQNSFLHLWKTRKNINNSLPVYFTQSILFATGSYSSAFSLKET